MALELFQKSFVLAQRSVIMSETKLCIWFLKMLIKKQPWTQIKNWRQLCLFFLWNLTRLIQQVKQSVCRYADKRNQSNVSFFCAQVTAWCFLEKSDLKSVLMLQTKPLEGQLQFVRKMTRKKKKHL